MDRTVCPKVPLMKWAPLVPWSTTDILFVGAHNTTSTALASTRLFAASPGHVCVKKALDSFSMDVDINTIENITERVNVGLGQCDMAEGDIAAQWDVHYINGYSKEECRRDWVEHQELPTRRIANNYVAGTRRVGPRGAETRAVLNPRPLLSENELSELVSIADPTTHRCVTPL